MSAPKKSTKIISVRLCSNVYVCTITWFVNSIILLLFIYHDIVVLFTVICLSGLVRELLRESRKKNSEIEERRTTEQYFYLLRQNYSLFMNMMWCVCLYTVWWSNGSLLFCNDYNSKNYLYSSLSHGTKREVRPAQIHHVSKVIKLYYCFLKRHNFTLVKFKMLFLYKLILPDTNVYVFEKHHS